MTIPTLPQTLLNSLGSQGYDYKPTVKERVDGSPKDYARLLGWVQQQYSSAKSARTKIERQWMLNLAFYRGKQNVAYISTTAANNGFRLLVPPAPPWRVRLVINKVRPALRKEMAKLTAQKPSFTVVPATNEDEDYYAAKAAEQVLEACYADYKLEAVVRSMVWWLSTCGTSFIKCYWDENKKAYKKGPVDPRLGKPSDIQGDTCVDPIVPLYIFVPDLLEEDIEKQAWVIHAFTKSRDWIREYYGKDVETKSTTKSTTDLLEDSFFDVFGSDKPRLQEQILCLEMWIKPGGHPWFPNGGMILVVGDQLYNIEDTYPYAHGQYPFIKFTNVPTGQFYAESVITDLIPLQKELNRTRSQIVENKNMMARPKLIYPKGAIDPNKITSEPGQGIPVELGYEDRIRPLEMPQLPSYVENEIVRIQQDMDDISGQHEVSRGQVPTQVTAATAISYLQEQDDTILALTTASIEAGMAKLGGQILSFAENYWDEERLIKVAGKDESFNIQFLKGSALRGNTDVRVQAGSALPTSKAARQALLLDLFKMGAFGPDPSEFLRIMDLPGVEKVIEGYKVDISQAQRENMKMALGQPQQVHDFDNNEIHLEYHDRYSKTQEYEMLPPEIQQIFIQHRMSHQQALQVNANAAAQAQAVQNLHGAPPNGAMPPNNSSPVGGSVPQVPGG
jgi:hypothetical protein